MQTMPLVGSIFTTFLSIVVYTYFNPYIFCKYLYKIVCLRPSLVLGIIQEVNK